MKKPSTAKSRKLAPPCSTRKLPPTKSPPTANSTAPSAAYSPSSKIIRSSNPTKISSACKTNSPAPKIASPSPAKITTTPSRPITPTSASSPTASSPLGPATNATTPTSKPAPLPAKSPKSTSTLRLRLQPPLPPQNNPTKSVGAQHAAPQVRTIVTRARALFLSLQLSTVDCQLSSHFIFSSALTNASFPTCT